MCLTESGFKYVLHMHLTNDNYYVLNNHNYVQLIIKVYGVSDELRDLKHNNIRSYIV